MAKPAPRCVRCNQKMRNDGTAEQPQWVCNNPKCVRYVPPEDNLQMLNQEDIEGVLGGK